MAKLIRVPAMFPWPNHGSHPAGNRYKPVDLPKPAHAGQRILTIGAPETPDRYWECGTDVVWQVFEIDGIPTRPPVGFRVCVCRHQIVAGD